MNNTKLECTLNDTTELRKLILENPDLPLIIFAGEEAYRDIGYSYTQCTDARCHIDEISLFNGEVWLDKDDYKERLSNDLCDNEEYKNLSDDEYFKMIDKKVAETEFVKEIIVYVG